MKTIGHNNLTTIDFDNILFIEDSSVEDTKRIYVHFKFSKIVYIALDDEAIEISNAYREYYTAQADKES